MQGNAILMHKDKQVCSLKFNTQQYIDKIVEIYDKSLLPPTIDGDDDNLKFLLTKWVQGRVFSPGRPDILSVRGFLQNKLNNCGKISLFDGYWFKTNKNETWEKINPYKNWKADSDFIVLLNTNPRYAMRNIDRVSPNYAIPGDTRDFIYKDKEENFYILSPNVMTEMAYYKKNIDNPYVLKRTYYSVNNNLFCAKPLQTSEDIEAFPLSGFYDKHKDCKEKGLQGLFECLEREGISKTETSNFMKYMYQADEVLDIDRDLTDVWILRDSNTFKLIGFAKL